VCVVVNACAAYDLVRQLHASLYRSTAESDGALQPGYFSNDWGSLNTSRLLLQEVLREDAPVTMAMCFGG
jgi:hypothetical protein